MSDDLDIISQFRESHHAIARMFAMGLTASMIRRQTGISIRRLTLLWGSPAFQDLIAFYARKAVEIHEERIEEYGDLATANMVRAERMIADKFDAAEDVGEFLPMRELIAVASDRADRFGYSKHQSVTVKHDFATALERAVTRSGKVEAMKQIEGHVVPSVSGPPNSMPPTRAQATDVSPKPGLPFAKPQASQHLGLGAREEGERPIPRHPAPSPSPNVRDTVNLPAVARSARSERNEGDRESLPHVSSRPNLALVVRRRKVA